MGGFIKAIVVAACIAWGAQGCSSKSKQSPGGTQCGALAVCAPSGLGGSIGGGGIGLGTAGVPGTQTFGASGTNGVSSPAANSSGGTGAAALTGAGGAAGRPGTAGATGGAGGASAPDPGVIMKPPMPSTGCGMTSYPPAGNQTIDVDGTPRDYITALPTGYDPTKPYRLIFAWHGLGGTAMQIASGFGGGYYGLQMRAMNTAIFIAGQGLPTSTGGGGAGGASGGAGWPNTGDRDIAFVRKMLDWATSKYCIDQSRIFSVGMSYGGIMSNTIGCELGDVFRAITPMSGSGPRVGFGGKACVGQVAAWLSHGNMDMTVPFAQGQASRDHWLQANHCGMTTMPVAPGTCVAYQGCDPAYPVNWCEFDGGHTVPTFASEAIWNFLSQF